MARSVHDCVEYEAVAGEGAEGVGGVTGDAVGGTEVGTGEGTAVEGLTAVEVGAAVGLTAVAITAGLTVGVEGADVMVEVTEAAVGMGVTTTVGIGVTATVGALNEVLPRPLAGSRMARHTPRPACQLCSRTRRPTWSGRKS